MFLLIKVHTHYGMEQGFLKMFPDVWYIFVLNKRVTLIVGGPSESRHSDLVTTLLLASIGGRFPPFPQVTLCSKRSTNLCIDLRKPLSNYILNVMFYLWLCGGCEQAGSMTWLKKSCYAWSAYTPSRIKGRSNFSPPMPRVEPATSHVPSRVIWLLHSS